MIAAFLGLFLAVVVNALDTEYNFRIAISGQDSLGMTISWSTNTSYSGVPMVKYGLSKSSLDLMSTGETIHYYETYHHHVTLQTKLEPQTNYFYQVGSQDDISQSIMSFTSPPLNDGSNFPLNVAIYGDMGVDNCGTTINQLKSRNSQGLIDLFLHIGDLSYGDDKGLEFGANKYYEPTYDEFLSSVDEFATGKPYMVCAGNHDVTCHSITDLGCQDQLRNFTAINSRFKMPSKESNGALNMWYSYNYGPVHFISINTETDYPGAPSTPSTIIGQGKGGGFGDQVAWLKADLEKANESRDQVPWIIIMGHRPMYSSSLTDYPPSTHGNLKKAFEDLFVQYKVDIYFAGHIHAYERSFLINNEKKSSTEEGIIHIVSGAAGNEEGISTAGSSQPDFIAYRNYEDYGWGELTIHNATTLEWNYYTSSNGNVDDHAVYTKNIQKKSKSSKNTFQKALK